jgi:hypothetical protein
MNIPLKASTPLLSLTIALLSVIPVCAVAQNTNAPASTTTPTPTKSAGVPTASKTGAAPSHETVEYKDPEDMTTRYRPGNNKTTQTPETPNAGTATANPAGTPAAPTDAKKHIANVKYNDRQAGIPALDAGSKDAAKTKAVPPPTPTTSKPGASTTQDSKHVNKVDSFTVKQ